MLNIKLPKFALLALKIVAGIIFLFAIGIIAILVIVDPNDYKKQIANMVKEKTGHSLTINGAISLSVFPSIGLKVKDISLSGYTGFENKPLITAKEVSISAKLFPLLLKRLETKSISLTQAQVTLVRNAQGKTNWQGLIAGSSNSPQNIKTASSVKQAGDNNKDTDANVKFDIATIKLVDSSIAYTDAQTGENYYFSNININSSGISKRELEQLHVSFDYYPDAQKKRKPAKIIFTSSVKANQSLDSILFEKFTLQIGKMTLHGHLNTSLGKSGQTLTGTLKTNTFSPKKLIATLGPPVNTTDPNALESMQASFKLKYSNSNLRLSAIQLRLDDTKMTGSIGARLSKNAPFFSYKLNIDKINFNRYLPKEGELAEQKRKLTKSHINAPGKSKHKKNAPVIIPITFLRSINASGMLSINQLTVSAITATSVKMPFSAQKGLIKFEKVSAKLYGGHYNGNITVDVSGKIPKISINESLTAIKGKSVYRFLKPYLKFGRYLTNITGETNLSLNISTHGFRQKQLIKNANGSAAINIKNGRLHGLNIENFACNLVELTRGRQGKRSPNNFTAFKLIKGNYKINKGVFSGNDFSLNGTDGLIQISGEGWGDMVNDRISYNIKADLVYSRCRAKAPKNSASKKRTLAIKIKGRLSDPKVKADIATMAKENLRQKLLDKLKKRGLEFDKKDGKKNSKDKKKITIEDILSL